MSSTYSTNLRTELIGSGDQAGTWGTTTNTTLGTILEQAIAGVSSGPYIGGTYPAVNFPTDADITLTANNGSVDQSRSAVLVVTSTGSLTATRNVIAPSSASKVYIIKNSTTGGQSIQIKYATGTGVLIANGYTKIVYGNGTNFYEAITEAGNFAVDGTFSGVGAANFFNTLSVAGAQTNSSTLQATTITATSQFSGPGTGLTGTAASLNIGGNAATATNATTATTANATAYSVVFSDAGAGGPANTSFNGSATKNVSFNTIGAPSTTGANASGTWGINITGNAATVTNGVYNNGGSYNINIGGNAGSATFASSANSLNTSNGYTVNGITSNGGCSLNGNAFLGKAYDSQLYAYGDASNILQLNAVTATNSAFRWLSIGGSPLLVGSGTQTNGASLTVGTGQGNGGVWCRSQNASPDYGWSMVNTDGRLGGFTIGNPSIGTYIQAVLDSTAWGIALFSSDKDLKKNIKPTTYNALNTISKLQFKEFDFDETKALTNKHVKCGIIAQEVQEIDPSLISKPGDYLQPNIDDMLYVTMKAVQELKAEVDSLKAELATLKG